MKRSVNNLSKSSASRTGFKYAPVGSRARVMPLAVSQSANCSNPLVLVDTVTYTGRRLGARAQAGKGSSTPFGETGPCSNRAVPARFIVPHGWSVSGRWLSNDGGRGVTAREILDRKIDCDPSTDFNLCAFERELLD